MWFLLIWLLLGFFTAMIAKSKGHNVGLWLILGLVFGIFALIAVAFVEDKTKEYTFSAKPDNIPNDGRLRGPSSRQYPYLQRSDLETLRKLVEGQPITDEQSLNKLEEMGYAQQWPKVSLTTKGERVAEEEGLISKT